MEAKSDHKRTKLPSSLDIKSSNNKKASNSNHYYYVMDKSDIKVRKPGILPVFVERNSPRVVGKKIQKQLELRTN